MKRAFPNIKHFTLCDGTIKQFSNFTAGFTKLLFAECQSKSTFFLEHCSTYINGATGTTHGCNSSQYFRKLNGIKGWMVASVEAYFHVLKPTIYQQSWQYIAICSRICCDFRIENFNPFRFVVLPILFKSTMFWNYSGNSTTCTW